MPSEDPPDSRSQDQRQPSQPEFTRLWRDDSLKGIEPGELRLQAWKRLRVAECRSLEGEQVLDWHGWRRALREAGPDGQPQFDDPSMPFRLCSRIFVRTLALGWVVFDTFSDEGSLGIYPGLVASTPKYMNQGIQREDDLDHLPTGKIDKVEVCVTDRGNIDRIMLSVEGWRLWLVASESNEKADGLLKLMDWDDRLFLFTDEEALNSFRWEDVDGGPRTHHTSGPDEGDPEKSDQRRAPLDTFLDEFVRRWFD